MPAVARWIAAAPLVGAGLLAVTVPIRPAYYFLLEEDRLVEWLQFALCLGASILAILYAVRRARAGRYASGFILLCVGVGLLGIAGEEISWGQRILGFATPDTLQDLNRQDEFNIHNITAGLDLEAAFRVGQTLVATLAIALSVLNHMLRGAGAHGAWRDWAPPLFMLPGLGLLVAYRFFRYFIYSDARAVVVQFQEWAEVWLYLAIAVTLYLSYGRWVRRMIACVEPSTSPMAPVHEARKVAIAVIALTIIFATVTLSW